MYGCDDDCTMDADSKTVTGRKFENVIFKPMLIPVLGNFNKNSTEVMHSNFVVKDIILYRCFNPGPYGRHMAL